MEESQREKLARVHVLATKAVTDINRMTAITKEEQAAKERVKSSIHEINQIAVSFSVIYDSSRGDAEARRVAE